MNAPISEGTAQWLAARAGIATCSEFTAIQEDTNAVKSAIAAIAKAEGVE